MQIGGVEPGMKSQKGADKKKAGKRLAIATSVRLTEGSEPHNSCHVMVYVSLADWLPLCLGDLFEAD